MALSQAQKNFFNVIASNPEQAWKDMQSGNVNLASYKDQFLKDGTGLLHLIVHGIIYRHPFAKEMYEHILLNSRLNVHDRANNKRESAYEVFTSRYKNTVELYGQYVDNEQVLEMFSDNLCYLLKHNKNDNSSFNKGLALLIKYGYMDLYDELYQTRQSSYEPSSDVLRFLTQRDDLSRIQQLFADYPDFSNKAATFNAYRVEPRAVGEISNFLVYAIDVQAFNTANYYMDNKMMLMDGKIKPANAYHNPYSSQSNRRGHGQAFAIHTFEQALKTGNMEILAKVIESMDLDERKIFFNNKRNSNTDSNGTYNYQITKKPSNFVYMLNHKDEDIKHFAWDFLSEYFQSLKSDTKSQYIFIQNIITDDMSLDNILKALKTVLPYYEKHLKHEWGMFNDRFFEESFKTFKEDRSQLAPFGQILSLMVEHDLFRFSPEKLFNETFFTDSEIFDTVANSGFDFNSNPKKDSTSFNLLSYYLKQYKSGIYQLKRDFDPVVVKQLEIRNLNKIYQKMGDNLLSLQTESNLSSNALELTLKHENFLILDLLTEHDLVNLALTPSIMHKKMSDEVIRPEDITNLTREHQMTISGHLRFIQPQTLENEENRLVYCNFIKKMMNIDYDFFQSSLLKNGTADLLNYPWYHLLRQHFDEPLLLNILGKHQQNIHELSQYTRFWDSPYLEKTFDFIKAQGADYDNSIGLITCCNREALFLEYYLKEGGSIRYQTENDGNILHYLVDNRQFEHANVVMNYYPDLACEVNNQKKFPVSYAIVYFSKQCADFATEPNISRKEELRQKMNITKKFIAQSFEFGLISKSKTSFNFIYNQMQKYENITRLHPELKTMLSYGKMTKEMENTYGSEEEEDSTPKLKI
jgi:hypothetical protein